MGELATRVGELLAASAREAVRVVVPLECAGCGEADQVVCPACSVVLARHRRLDGDASALRAPLAVWGVGHYEGVLRHLVLAWKLGGRRDVEPRLTHALAGAATAWHAQADVPRGEVWVVPAPSGLGRRLGGRPSVTRLAEPLARELARSGRSASVVRSLAAAAAGSGHVGPGHAGTQAERQERTTRAVRARLRHDGVVVVLVDDVMTTGATLEACRGAVEATGGVVVGALVLAGARVRGRRSGLHDRPRAVD